MFASSALLRYSCADSLVGSGISATGPASAARETSWSTCLAEAFEVLAFGSQLGGGGGITNSLWQSGQRIDLPCLRRGTYCGVPQVLQMIRYSALCASVSASSARSESLFEEERLGGVGCGGVSSKRIEANRSDAKTLDEELGDSGASRGKSSSSADGGSGGDRGAVGCSETGFGLLLVGSVTLGDTVDLSGEPFGVEFVAGCFAVGVAAAADVEALGVGVLAFGGAISGIAKWKGSSAGGVFDSLAKLALTGDEEADVGGASKSNH
jgi:hypothetical protein